MARQFRTPGFWTISFLSAVLTFSVGSGHAEQVPHDRLSEESAACIGCHKSESVGIYQQWGASKHYALINE